MHRVVISHHRELAQIGGQHGLENIADHALEHVANVLLSHERGFNINLREFRLAVSTQVFVAKALGDLVIAVKAGDHEQLLEELRALRQRKELAFVDAAGHQVVARAFGRAFGEHRCFNVDEAIGIKELARFHGHAVAQHQVVLHVRAAQVQHPVGQARGFRQVVIVQLKGRRHAGVEHGEFVAQHFNLAAFEVVVDSALWAGTHQALDLNTELVAYAFGGLEHIGAVRVTDHLHITFAVAQVNEDHPAMVTAAVHPAAQADRLAHQGVGDQAAIVGAHLGGDGHTGLLLG